MLLVLDAGAVINDESFDFIEGHRYVMPPKVSAEFKDTRSKMLVENALKHRLLEIIEPQPRFVELVEQNIKEIGMRLSQADISLLALAEQLRFRQPIVISDDYSVQNYCKHHNLEFRGAIMGEIEKAKTFRRKGRE